MSLWRIRALALCLFSEKICKAMLPVLLVILAFACINAAINFENVGFKRFAASLIVAVVCFCVGMMFIAAVMFAGVVSFNARYRNAWRQMNERRDAVDLVDALLRHLRLVKS